MTEGDVGLAPLPQADGCTKPRPTILLRRMPPFGDWLICGVSTQLRQEVVGFDDIIAVSHADFRLSGLRSCALAISLYYPPINSSEGLAPSRASATPDSFNAWQPSSLSDEVPPDEQLHKFLSDRQKRILSFC